jgi:hypothetical protein
VWLLLLLLLQGLRATTIQGVPTPSELIDALLGRLHPALPQLSAAELCDMAGALAATGHATRVDVARELIAACTARLAAADVQQVMALLFALPAVQGAMAAAGSEGAEDVASQIQAFKHSCVQQVRFSARSVCQ